MSKRKKSKNNSSSKRPSPAPIAPNADLRKRLKALGIGVMGLLAVWLFGLGTFWVTWFWALFWTGFLLCLIFVRQDFGVPGDRSTRGIIALVALYILSFGAGYEHARRHEQTQQLEKLNTPAVRVDDLPQKAKSMRAALDEDILSENDAETSDRLVHLGPSIIRLDLGDYTTDTISDTEGNSTRYCYALAPLVAPEWNFQTPVFVWAFTSDVCDDPEEEAEFSAAVERDWNQSWDFIEIAEFPATTQRVRALAQNLLAAHKIPSPLSSQGWVLVQRFDAPTLWAADPLKHRWNGLLAGLFAQLVLGAWAWVAWKRRKRAF